MKERPILFSAPMVRALLAETKTQTRRISFPQPVLVDGLWHVLYPWGEGGHGIHETERALREEYDRLLLAHCPHGRAGDRLCGPRRGGILVRGRFLHYTPDLLLLSHGTRVDRTHAVTPTPRHGDNS